MFLVLKNVIDQNMTKVISVPTQGETILDFLLISADVYVNDIVVDVPLGQEITILYISVCTVKAGICR